jgi:hypothetical protein
MNEAVKPPEAEDWHGHVEALIEKYGAAEAQTQAGILAGLNRSGATRRLRRSWLASRRSLRENKPDTHRLRLRLRRWRRR